MSPPPTPLHHTTWHTITTYNVPRAMEQNHPLQTSEAPRSLRAALCVARRSAGFVLAASHPSVAGRCGPQHSGHAARHSTHIVQRVCSPCSSTPSSRRCSSHTCQTLPLRWRVSSATPAPTRSIPKATAPTSPSASAQTAVAATAMTALASRPPLPAATRPIGRSQARSPPSAMRACAMSALSPSAGRLCIFRR